MLEIALFDEWYSEELEPETIERKAVKRDVAEDTGPDEAASEALASLRPVLRIGRPHWRRIEPDTSGILPADGAEFVLVRLAFQFDMPSEAKASKAQITSARCAAKLWADRAGDPQPLVYDLYPRDLYEGEPRKISVKLSPSLKLAEAAEVSLGEIGTEFQLGVVEPSVVGWPGNEEREPYWELTPQTKSLIGVRHLWLVVQKDRRCLGFRLSMFVRGILSTPWIPFIPFGPRSEGTGTRQRPSELIA